MTHLTWALAFTLVLFSRCGDSNMATENNDAVDSSNQNAASTKDIFKYDASKDGMLVAPAITRKIGDSLGIKMYEVTVMPGDSIPLHNHPDHAFYVIEGVKAAIYFGSERQEWQLNPGMGFVNGPVSDAAKNIGKTAIKFIVVDIYRPR